MQQKDILHTIRELVSDGRYRVKIHAVRHMIEEGFSEKDVIGAIIEEITIIELYEEERRCLALGYFLWNSKVKSPLHMVIDYSSNKVIDIVTAYIPQRPWWISPTRRGKKK